MITLNINVGDDIISKTQSGESIGNANTVSSISSPSQGFDAASNLDSPPTPDMSTSLGSSESISIPQPQGIEKGLSEGVDSAPSPESGSFSSTLAVEDAAPQPEDFEEALSPSKSKSKTRTTKK